MSQAEREHRVRRGDRARIVLLRHAEPDWEQDGPRTVRDPRLTRAGRDQARRAARALGGQPIDGLYTSPLRRARETAEPLGRLASMRPVVVDALEELRVDFGGRTQAEVDRIFRQAAHRPLERHWEGLPGGEAFRDFRGRVVAAVEWILGRHGITPCGAEALPVWRVAPSSQTLVIVAHGGTNAVVMTHLLGIPGFPWESVRCESALASHSSLQARALGPDGAVWSLQAFNRTDHLLDAPIPREVRAGGPSHPGLRG